MPQANAKIDKAPAAAAVPGPIELTINGEIFRHTGAPDMPLLWYLRDVLRLTGSKYGCGVGQCGACTVHVDGKAQRSCLLPVSALAGQTITTIEGVASGDDLHAVQQAWIDEDVPQCGYCQAGQIMQAAALLKQQPRPSAEQIDAAMAGNLCRCGSYIRIRAAIAAAASDGAAL
jgi:isoquinoline 1-oxidoreductase subunit alpha